MTADAVDRFTRRTLHTLHALPSAQRAAVVEQILRDDADLAPVLPQLLALVARVRYLRRVGPLLRDGVSALGRGEEIADRGVLPHQRSLSACGILTRALLDR